MFKTARARILGAAAIVVTAMASVSAVVAMTVQPVVIDLTTSGRGMSQVLTVENTFTTPLPVEMRVEDLNLTDNGVQGAGKDSGDLLIFPPQALIQPGQTQSFRVQYVGEPDLETSKHYYATVAQLPVQLPEGQSAIQILYNFQVLVSVSPDGQRPNLTVQGAEIGRNNAGEPVPLVTLTNASRAHGYLSRGRLRIIARDAQGREVLRRQMPGPEIQQTIGFGLVGAGQTRKMTIPVTLPAEAVAVEAQYTPENGR